MFEIPWVKLAEQCVGVQMWWRQQIKILCKLMQIPNIIFTMLNAMELFCETHLWRWTKKRLFSSNYSISAWIHFNFPPSTETTFFRSTFHVPFSLSLLRSHPILDVHLVILLWFIELMLYLSTKFLRNIVLIRCLLPTNRPILLSYYRTLFDTFIIAIRIPIVWL